MTTKIASHRFFSLKGVGWKKNHLNFFNLFIFDPLGVWGRIGRRRICEWNALGVQMQWYETLLIFHVIHGTLIMLFTFHNKKKQQSYVRCEIFFFSWKMYEEHKINKKTSFKPPFFHSIRKSELKSKVKEEKMNKKKKNVIYLNSD